MSSMNTLASQCKIHPIHAAPCGSVTPTGVRLPTAAPKSAHSLTMAWMSDGASGHQRHASHPRTWGGRHAR